MYENLLKDCDIKLSNGKLNINGVDYTLTEFRKNLFDLADMNDPDYLPLMKLERTDKAIFNDKTKEIYEGVRKELLPTLDTGLELENDLEALTPVVAMETDEVFLIDESKNIVSDIKYNSWLKAIDPSFKKVIMSSKMPMAKFIFNPYTCDKVWRGSVDSGAREMLYINTYLPPAWSLTGNHTTEIPTFLKDFMNHLFEGRQDQITYCLRWLAEAYTGRNETYLVLNGDKGVGKNTLYEIMKAVVSPKYAVTAPQSLTTSHFNSVLLNKRLILLDEYKITRSNHLFLKKVINKYQTIEKKGIDADREVETFNSFMVFHNDISDMYLEKDDRRFSVLDLTSKNLLELWGAEELDGYMRQLNDPNSQLVSDIGSYLLSISKTEFDNAKPFKGTRFHEIVEYHMPTWLQIVVAMIENKEVKKGVISFKKEIEKKLSSEMMGNKKIQWRKSTLVKVLSEYRYKDKWSLGKIEGGTKKGLELIVNPDLLDLFDYEQEEEESIL